MAGKRRYGGAQPAAQRFRRTGYGSRSLPHGGSGVRRFGLLRGRRAGYLRRGGYYGRYNTPGGAGELKFFETAIDDAVVVGAGAVSPSVNLIPQGVTESTRVGRKCTLKALMWRGNVTLPEQDAQTTPQSGDVVRLMVILDKQANGAVFTVTDILETADWQSFNNLANSSRFRVLMDRLITLNYQGLASDGAGVVSQANYVLPFTFFKKCNIPLEFSSTTGAIGEIRSNNVTILAITSGGIAGLGSNFRVRFADGGA